MPNHMEDHLVTLNLVFRSFKQSCRAYLVKKGDPPRTGLLNVPAMYAPIVDERKWYWNNFTGQHIQYLFAAVNTVFVRRNMHAIHRAFVGPPKSVIHLTNGDSKEHLKKFYGFMGKL